MTYHICQGFAATNITLGLGFIFLMDPNRLSAPLLLVNDIFTFEIWGLTFIVLATYMTYGLVTNNWSYLKRSMLIGLSIKITWLTTLIIRVTESPSTILLVAIWMFFAYIQAVTYVYFLPTGGGHAGAE